MNMKNRKNKLTYHPNAVVIRLHNKKIQIVEKDNAVYLGFRFADEDADTPACEHKCIKGKVRQTRMKLSLEVMEAISYSYFNLKQHQKELAQNDTP